MSVVGKEISVTIERLAGLGEGCGTWEGKKVFVPYTLAGEQVKATITQETAEFLRAKVTGIDKRAADRIDAPCKHFTVCGGCSLQHLSPESYRAFKAQMLVEALRKSGFDRVVPTPMVEIGAGTRRRVEWSVREKNGEVLLGFLEGKGREVINIDECRVLIPQLQQLIHPLRAALKKLKLASHIESVQALYLGHTLAVGVVPKGTLSPSLEPLLVALGNALGVGRLSVYDASGPKLLLEKRSLTRVVDGMQIDIPAFSFLQASDEAEHIMIEEVLRGLKGCKKIVDLFCGMGTFGLPLTIHARVVGFETVAWMTKALADAIVTHNLAKRIEVLQRDLFQAPLTATELAAFDGIVINPPRNGAKEQCEEIAHSNVKKVVMISCNPATFARDAKILREGGYGLTKAMGIDQFVYSPHLEVVAHFEKA